MRWILNSAVLTGPGTYTYQLISDEEAIAWVKAGHWTSRVGYTETAAQISRMTGVYPEISREPSPMKAGDEALVVRLKYRGPAFNKGKYKPHPSDWEFGILIKKE